MPRFRFIAADSTGQVHDGAINAATQSDARNKLAAHGLAVRELEETASEAESISAPARRAASPVGEALEPRPMRRSQRPEPAEPAPRRFSAPLVIAIMALIVSVASAVYSMYRDPFAGRLNRYDFSTPERAYMSHLRMHATADLPAMMELQRRQEGKHLRDKLESAKVIETEEHGGKTILFIEYRVGGVKAREVQCFEPDPEQRRFWRLTHLSDHEIRAENQALADRVSRWRTGEAVGGRDRMGSGPR